MEIFTQLVRKVLGAVLSDAGTSPTHGGGSNHGTDGGLCVVYSGKKDFERHCAEAAAQVVRTAFPQSRVVLAGPGSNHELTPELITQTSIYVQPGGGLLEPTYKKLKHIKEPLRAMIRNGGSYLGFCLGGYLAGKSPGFDLLPGDTDQYIGTERATIDHDGDAVVVLSWQGTDREMYFQGGPVFEVDESRVEVVARYQNGSVAALIAPFGAGKVAVCGPHPEATADWFEEMPRASYTDATDLAVRLVQQVVTR